MDIKTKRIIAREGLILLVTIGLGIFLISIALYFRPSLKDIFDEISPPNGFVQWGIIIKLAKALIIAYPVSWLIRFVIWAVKTLKQK